MNVKDGGKKLKENIIGNFVVGVILTAGRIYQMNSTLKKKNLHEEDQTVIVIVVLGTQNP